jgi:hypothetical protein
MRISHLSFELGMKEVEGIKDAKALVGAQNNAFVSLIPSYIQQKKVLGYNGRTDWADRAD